MGGLLSSLLGSEEPLRSEDQFGSSDLSEPV